MLESAVGAVGYVIRKLNQVRENVLPSQSRFEAIGIIEALILALAAVATAWSGYQAASWAGRRAEQYAESSRLRVAAEGLAALAGQERIYNSDTFNSWLAGHDGNVYKNTGNGWEKYDNGSWNSVSKPQPNWHGAESSQQRTASESYQQRTSAASSSNRSSEGSADRSDFSSQRQDLDREAQNRSRGGFNSQRSQDFQRGGFDRFGGGGFGGDRFGGGGGERFGGAGFRGRR